MIILHLLPKILTRYNTYWDGYLYKTLREKAEYNAQIQGKALEYVREQFGTLYQWSELFSEEVWLDLVCFSKEW